MAIAIRSVDGVNGDGSVTSASVTLSAVAAGDLLLAIATADSDGNAANLTATGFTQAGPIQTGGGPPTGKVWWKAATSADAAAPTFAFGQDTNASFAIVMASLSGADTTNPFDVVPAWATAAASNVMTAPSISPANPDSWLVCLFCGQNGGAPTFTPPTGMTKLLDKASIWDFVGTAYQQLSASGATGTKTSTATASSSSAYIAASMAINTASAAPAGRKGLFF